jgi:hypothetical protein
VAESSRLRASDLEVGLPVILVGATEGIPVHGKPEARLLDGHPGRIRRWYGEDHVVVEWYGYSDDDVSEFVGFARDEEDGTYGLIPITEVDYLRRCEDARRMH